MNKKSVGELFEQFFLLEQKFGFEPLIAVIKTRAVFEQINCLVLGYFNNLVRTGDVDESYVVFLKNLVVKPEMDVFNNPVSYLDFWNYELKNRDVLFELCVALKIFEFKTVGVYQPLVDDSGLAEFGVQKIKVNKK